MHETRFQQAFRILVVACVFSAAQLVSAKQAAPAFIPVAGASEAPRGFLEMCQTSGDFCTARRISAQGNSETSALAGDAGRARRFPAAMTVGFDTGSLARPAPTVAQSESIPVSPVAASLSEAGREKLIGSVNRLVNSRVRQRTDLQTYNRNEIWQRSGIGNGATGDCEDLAIEKRYQLIAAGFPSDRLAFAVVYSTATGLHAVLIARTDRGDVVLDSRSPFVRPWHDAPYSWITVQSMNDPMSWGLVQG